MAEQSSVYPEFIASELKAERDRKAAIDARAASLITTSGSLVTVLAAIGAFLGKDSDWRLPQLAFPFIAAALIAFTVASVAGIISGWSRAYAVPDIAPLKRMLNDRWRDEEDLARIEICAASIEMIESLRKINAKKERTLRVGWFNQIAAIILLSVVVITVIATI
ncbi:hypothetical protein [Micromonospora sp. DT41]|uniref:hypothetical protein n=1 Tax=Micromonospora sp. DT41 TaxID=3393437 RepID=UPI003CEF05B3